MFSFYQCLTFAPTKKSQFAGNIRFRQTDPGGNQILFQPFFQIDSYPRLFSNDFYHLRDRCLLKDQHLLLFSKHILRT